MIKNATLLLVLFVTLFQNNNLHSQNKKTFDSLKFSNKVLELYDAGKDKEVLVYSDSILKAISPLNSLDSLDYGRVYHLKAKSLFELSRYNESLETLDLGKKYIEPLNIGKNVLSGMYYYMHINYGVQSKLFECIKYGDLSVNILQGLENPEYDLLLKLYGRMAVYSSQAGDATKAYSYMKKGEVLLENLPANTQLNLPKVSYKIKLLYRKILVSFINQIFKSTSDTDPKTLLVDKMVEKDKKQLDSLFLNNKKVVKKGNNKSQYDNDTYYYALALNFYCYYFADKKMPSADINSLHKEIDKAIKLLQKKYYRRHLYQFKSTKAKLYQNQKQYKNAMAIFNEIIDNTDDTNNNRSNFYIYKALALFDTNNIDEGKKLIHKALSIIHSSSDSLAQDFSNFKSGYKFGDVVSISNLSDKVNNPQYNFENKKAYAAALINVAFKQFTGTYKSQSLNKVTNRLFKRILKRLIANESMTDDYFSKVENIQNYFAWKQFNQNRNVVQLPVVDSLENIEYQLRKQLTVAKRKRNNETKDSILTQLETHQNSIKKDYPKIFEFSQDDFNISEFQKNLGTNDVVLKYIFFNDEFAIFQITRNSIENQIKPFGVEEKRLFNTHIQQIRDRKSTIAYDDKLTELLVPKSVLNQYENLIIIPDNTVYKLPFETLRYKDKFLLEFKTIRYSSHLRFAFFDNNKNDSENVFLSIFAPEYLEGKSQLETRSSNYFLEGAQKEANAISTLFNSDSYFGENATKSNFVTNKSKANVIHLAMHATINENNPELSHFNFSDNEALYIEELYGLKIPAKLAVLSACNTGVGYNDDNNVTGSLQHAFNYAGTKASVASIWEVPDDATSAIMIDFYKNLKKGETKSKALSNAKLNYLNNAKIEKLRHPYYWAGFVLYGDDTAVVSVFNFNIVYTILAIAGIIFFGLFLMRYSKKEA